MHAIHTREIVAEQPKMEILVLVIIPAGTLVFKIKNEQNEKANQKTQPEQKNNFKPSVIRDG